MVAKSIKSARCDDVLKAFMTSSKGCVFLTMTTPDVVDIYGIRKRWRGVRHFLCEKYKGVKYVMNFEIHPRGHGWHIHSVWNRFIPLTPDTLYKFREFGFGRVDIRRVNSKGVSDYLTKHALKAYRGVSKKEMQSNPSFRLRLVNASRGLPVLSDYEWRSDLKTKVKKSFNMYRLNHEGQLKCFKTLYSQLEVCALLHLQNLAQLSFVLSNLRRKYKLARGSQLRLDL